MTVYSILPTQFQSKMERKRLKIIMIIMMMLIAEFRVTLYVGRV